MKLISDKPYKIIWLFIPVIVLLMMAGFNNKIDIQFNNSYYVIDALYAGVFLSVYFGMTGFIYWIFRNNDFISPLTLIHVLSTILVAVILIFVIIKFQSVAASNPVNFVVFNYILYISAGCFMLSQLLFIINLVISLTKWR